jgi:YVTN family beta-propeller protein
VSLAARVALLLVLLSITLHSSRAGEAPGTGPGLPNRTYPSRSVFQPLASFTASMGAPRAHNSVSMVNGYLAVVYSQDAVANGGIAFFDLSDPRRPRLVHRQEDAVTHDLSEAHSCAFSLSGGRTLAVLQAARGVQFWDWTDVRRPTRLSYLSLPGIADTEYAAGAWWVSWQAPYVYVGGSTRGVYVVEARDPRRPRFVRRIPTSRTGGFRVGSTFAVGNLLVIAGSGRSGLATLDISDPERPRAMAIRTRGIRRAYSAMVNGGRVLTVADRLYVYDLSDPTRFRLVNSAPLGGQGGYLTVQDGFAHCGASTRYTKVDIRDPEDYRVVGSATSGFEGRDEDAATVLGNLVFVSNDHDLGGLGVYGQGSVLVPHQREPDRTGPAVNMVVPADGAVEQAVTSRVGITLTDQIDLRSVSPAAFTVRPQGGEPLTGRYSCQTGILNFSPDRPLERGTLYEVRVSAGGLRDWAGNPVERTFVSHFATAAAKGTPLRCQLLPGRPAESGKTCRFEATAVGAAPIRYSWDFGDGTPPRAAVSASRVEHRYAAPGHYTVTVTARNARGHAADSRQQTVYLRPTRTPPAASSSILVHGDRVWSVNADSGTVSCVDASQMKDAFELPTGEEPRTLARAPDGSVWVVNQGPATITRVSASGGFLGNLRLPRASRPFGIVFAPDGSAAYVTLEATGQLLKLDAASGETMEALAVCPSPRGLAVSADSKRVYVARFISPADRGEVIEVAAPTLKRLRNITLAPDPGPDTELSGRGVPNYVAAPVITPDGRRAWVPSKKDNTSRGSFRDGRPLTFESTVRTIASQIDLVAGAERLGDRIDFNNRDLAVAVAFSRLGDYAFVALQGSDTVDVVDAYTREVVTSIEGVGIAPQGLALDDSGTRLFVRSFLSREVAAFDLSGLVRLGDTDVPRLGAIRTVRNEPLPPQVLRGKRIFYRARDPRMSQDGYLSCASCHLDGDSDGRVWDFTDRGEGLRNTISLLGHRGMAQGRLHWTANFDEIQDFEGDIRGSFGGDGFLSDADFDAHRQPLGSPKAGLSADLDALAAYVSSLAAPRPSPFRTLDGALTADGRAGRELFLRLGCSTCHAGADFTDSATGALHDVGTLKPSSGRRLGAPLTGLDTPTLVGLWETAPYLHDGSAPTLADVLTAQNRSGRHADLSGVGDQERAQLIAYLLQIDGSEPPGLPARPRATALSGGTPPGLAGRAAADGTTSRGTTRKKGDEGNPGPSPPPVRRAPRPFRGHHAVRDASGILMVSALPLATAADLALFGRLTAEGYSVELTDRLSAQDPLVSRAAVVLVTASAEPGGIDPRARSLAVPVIVSNSRVLAVLGMTGPRAGVDFGEADGPTRLRIAAPGHPLAAGLSGAVPVFAAPADPLWGQPAAGGQAVALVPGRARRAAVFAYEQGARMRSGPAPARRVGFFLPGNGELTPEGWSLLEAAVRWSSGRG